MPEDSWPVGLEVGLGLPDSPEPDDEPGPHATNRPIARTAAIAANMVFTLIFIELPFTSCGCCRRWWVTFGSQ